MSSAPKAPFVVGDDGSPGALNFGLEHFCIPDHYAADLENVMIPHGLIIDRIEKLALDMCRSYDFKSGTRLHMLCVLKGGHQFFSDLCNVLKRLTLRHCTNAPLTFDFIRVKSYAGTESTGEARVESIGVDLASLKGRHVLLCEDIIDTGTTMAKLVPHLETFGPASVRVATLLKKRTPKSNGFQADFTGFTIPDKFVVGYCLDYNEVFRDMEHICVMNPSGIARHANAGSDKA